MTNTYDWEPSYGFMHTNKVQLAAALEQVRRQVCAYRATGDDHCDCKYGIDQELTDEWRYVGAGGKSRNYISSEMTGCPELRSVINMLLHSDEEKPSGSSFLKKIISRS